jgi:hypothetical protein
MNIYRILPKLLPICAGLLLLSGCVFYTGGLPSSANTKEKYLVISSIHGIKQVTVSANLQETIISYTPTNEIVLNTNTTHGWLIQIKPAEKQIYVREFYILPKPARWNIKQGFISFDNTTCVRDFIVPKGAKYINDSWGMFADDPLGEYRIAILLDFKLAADFKFRVIEAAKPACVLK